MANAGKDSKSSNKCQAVYLRATFILFFQTKVQRLFEGGVYLRAAFIQINTTNPYRKRTKKHSNDPLASNVAYRKTLADNYHFLKILKLNIIFKTIQILKNKFGHKEVDQAHKHQKSSAYKLLAAQQLSKQICDNLDWFTSYVLQTFFVSPLQAFKKSRL
uniref:Uncharacterized protein n=1 Tax=Romanomermis culicivorax TaxID=13658 RepID=A0A915HJE4_ROMCU